VTKVWISLSTVARFYYRSVLVSLSTNGFGVSTMYMHLKKLLLCYATPVKMVP
jgi:hypothetical protein